MELVSRCVECGLAEPESLASLGGSAPGVVDGILSGCTCEESQVHSVEREQPHEILHDCGKRTTHSQNFIQRDINANIHWIIWIVDKGRGISLRPVDPTSFNEVDTETWAQHLLANVVCC